MARWMLKRVQHDGIWPLLAAFCLLLLALPVHAQTFPPLTGRVVDTAQVLNPQQAAALDAKLAAIEQTTGHQLVVATIPTLGDYPIEDYGYKLLRTWGIGSKATNDGAILLIAKDDRKLRIEVGYGLEPLLTDAYSSIVINTVITPRFKAGDFAGGIDAGVDAIADQIKLSPEEAAKRTAQLAGEQKQRAHKVNPSAFIFWIVIFFFFIVPLFRRMGGGRSYGGGGIGNIILWSALNGLANSGRSSGSGSDWGSGGGGWGGGDGGGFSGGGGSGGGGGASGGW